VSSVCLLLLLAPGWQVVEFDATNLYDKKNKTVIEHGGDLQLIYTGPAQSVAFHQRTAGAESLHNSAGSAAVAAAPLPSRTVADRILSICTLLYPYKRRNRERIVGAGRSLCWISVGVTGCSSASGVPPVPCLDLCFAQGCWARAHGKSDSGAAHNKVPRSTDRRGLRPQASVALKTSPAGIERGRHVVEAPECGGRSRRSCCAACCK
jgi:hypothetical protein